MTTSIPAANPASNAPKPNSLRASQTEGNHPTSEIPETASDRVELNKKATAEAKEAKTSKPFYQVIVDFFESITQKFMDIFKPTSREALEKALEKADYKAGLYQSRIRENLNTLEKSELSETQKQLLEKDIEKAMSQRDQLLAKYETYSDKLNKLNGKSAAASGKEALSKASAGEEAASKLKPEQLDKTAQQTLEELFDDALKQLDEITAQVKKSAPEKIETMMGQLKKLAK